jgi:hypothetical protein
VLVLGDLVAVLIGIGSGLLAVLLMQAWPTRCRWAKKMSVTEGRPSGQPIYQAKFGHKHRRVFGERRSPVDISFAARFSAKGLGRRRDTPKVVSMPVHKDWRPAIGGYVTVVLLPSRCELSDLRYFPKDVVEKRKAGTLTLQDLLEARVDGEEVHTAKVKLYAYGYRPFTGTRWMLKKEYDLAQVRPGYYRRESLKLEESVDGKLPPVNDLELE